MSRTPHPPATFPPTLNAARVDALPVYVLPRTYRLGDLGMGCYGDPPGFPTYYIRPVYNGAGNSPRNAPDAVLLGTDGKLRRADPPHTDGARESFYRRLYLPLPVEHPRVQAWIAATMAHLANCYQDEERPEYGRPGTLVFPVPSYKLKTFRDDPRWNEGCRTAGKAEAEEFNRMEIERATRIATLDNHRGVRAIRAHYPDWSPPDPGMVNGIPGYRHAGWWTTADEKPAPDACPGDRSVNMKHKPDYCQWCGIGGAS